LFYLFIRRKEGDDKDNLLVSTKQVNGCSDDILDILVIPPNPEGNPDIITDSNTISQAIAEGNLLDEKKFLLALLTNSPQVGELVQTPYSSPTSQPLRRLSTLRQFPSLFPHLWPLHSTIEFSTSCLNERRSNYISQILSPSSVLPPYYSC
jgi:hypothetical protein